MKTQNFQTFCPNYNHNLRSYGQLLSLFQFVSGMFELKQYISYLKKLSVIGY